MLRALTALAGFAAAALILWFVPDAGDVVKDPAWGVPLLWAAAGFTGGLVYQAGGALRLRPNLPLLILVALPWALITVALVAVTLNDPVWIADRARDVLPDTWLARWRPSLGVFAFGSGLLLAFGLLDARPTVRTTVPRDAEARELAPAQHSRPVTDATDDAAV